MRDGDEEAVSRLIHHCFHRFIGKDYKPEGLRKFLEDTSPESMVRVGREWPLVMVCEHQTRRGDVSHVGVIALRLPDHISLFFVDEAWHRRGVGRLLLKEALRSTTAQHTDIRSITVNSSPYAVGFYEKMGFQRLGSEQYMDGMLVNPMIRHL
jgi:GNAT superfamily N-acetyltransferase